MRRIAKVHEAAVDFPLPVAALARRARNAKSPRDRHDALYFAWEASVRLAVAADPPERAEELARPSLGDWVAALKKGDASFDAPELIAVCRLFSEVGTGRSPNPERVTVGKLLEFFPTYRRRAWAHSSLRESTSYSAAADVLERGLAAAWAAGVFLPQGSRLVYVESVELDDSGGHRGRVRDLTGLASEVTQDGKVGGLPTAVRPRRLYVRREDGAWQSLHPWLLYEGEDLHERVLFFNGLTRAVEFLDYASGEVFLGKELKGKFTTLEDDVTLFRRVGPAAADSKEEHSDFRVIGELGRGRAGSVQLACQESLGRWVALRKPADMDTSQRALVAALARCDHPNLVKVFSSGEDAGVPCYAMEFLQGADLGQVAGKLADGRDLDGAISEAAAEVRRSRAELLAQAPDLARGPDGPALTQAGRDRGRRAAELLRDAARGLDRLHEAGIVHGEVRASNLMLTEAKHRIVLMDSAAACPVESGDRRADLRGLGVAFSETIGRVGLPRRLARILERATSGDPAVGYGTAGELIADVDRFLDLGGARRRRRDAAILGGALVVIGVLGFLLTKSWRENRTLRLMVGDEIASAVHGTPADWGPTLTAAGGSALTMELNLLREALVGGEWKPVPVADGDTLYDRSTKGEEEDLYRVHFRTSFPCYVYIFQRDESDRLYHLFPSELTEEGNPVQAERDYHVPDRPGRTWFRLDTTKGTEHIFFLAFPERSRPLESTLAKLADPISSASPTRVPSRPISYTRGIEEAVGGRARKTVLEHRKGVEEFLSTVWRLTAQRGGIVKVRSFRHQ